MSSKSTTNFLVEVQVVDVLHILIFYLFHQSEHVTECYLCARPLAETRRSYTTISCHGDLVYLSYHMLPYVKANEIRFKNFALCALRLPCFLIGLWCACSLLSDPYPCRNCEVQWLKFLFHSRLGCFSFLLCWLTCNLSYCLQLYMAPITNAERYADSIDFWRNVYGIDSKYG